MRRRLRILTFVLVFLAVVVPGVVLYYAVFTESGLQTIVSRIPKRVGRAQIEIVNATGTLARGVHVERLVIDHERVHLRFEDIRGRITLPPLLWQTIRSPDLFVREASIEVRRRTSPPPPRYTPRFLPLGLVIRGDRVRVASGTLILPSGRRFEGTDLQASGVVRHRTIRVFDADLTTSGVRAQGIAELRAASPIRITAEARITRQAEGQPDWVIAASADGDLDELPLQARFTSPFRADFKGAAVDLTRGWKWSGNAAVLDFDPMVWGGGAILGHITGQLALEGDAGGFTARGPLTPDGLEIGPVQTLLEGSYASRTVFAKRLEFVHGPSSARVLASGAIGIVAGGPRLDLQGTWRNFRWPLVGANPGVRSPSGRYTLTGIWPYDLRASGLLAPARLEPMPVRMVGQLAKGRLIMRQTDVEALGGEATLSGEMEWTPQERWSVSGKAFGINPAGIRDDLPGKLDFDFVAAGDGYGAEAGFTTTVSNLDGRLRGVAASGSGKLARLDGVWQFEQVRMNLGRTDIALDGRIDERLDLRFALNSQDLSLLAPESRGRLRARGIVNGTLEDPVLDITASGSGIRHAGITLETLEALVDFDARQQRPSKVDIRARNVTIQERKLDRLNFTLTGTAAHHAFEADAKAGSLALKTSGTGAFDAGNWSGLLQQLQANGTESLHLDLESPVNVQLSKEQMRLERLCLQGKPARMCGDAGWSPQRWSVNLDTSGLPISTLMSSLPPTVEYRGTINASMQAFGGPDMPVQGHLRADLANARLLHRRAGGRIQTITLGSGLVTLIATDTAIEAQVGLDAGSTGTIAGRFDADRTAERWQDMPLRGRLIARTGELGFLTLYLPQVDRATGELAANLALGGTLGTPLVDGVVKLAGAELDFYQINLAMRGVTMEARLLDNGLNFSGSTRIGEGTASAQGRLEWRDALPYGKFRLTGERLRVVDIPEARIDASPKLDFQIDGRKIEVSGAVNVPYANIEPADITGAVRTSSDEIIVGEQAPDPSERFQVVTAITLTLGENVSIDTSGLTGKLAGSLTLRSGIDEITRGAGELGVTEGRYAAYGRLLDIERGRLIFSGGPIENPGVDIRAVRQFPEIKAGVNVRGTLLQPRMTFFSEPSLPQSQVVSLILAGGALGTTAQSNANGNSGAGTELLAQGGAILAQQLGSRVGIEDVGIESNLDNETAIVLGKYLSPRLYVSYGISLTESLNTLKLRYTLGDRWTIRTEVGEERSADLVYTIEK